MFVAHQYRGDVAHRINLTLVAIRESQALADDVLDHHSRQINHDDMSAPAFSQL